MNKKRVFSKGEVQDMIELYAQEHVTVVDIGRKYHTNPAKISEVLVANGVKLKRGGYPKKYISDNDEAIRLYKSGHTLKEIGLKFGVSPQKIRKICLENGVDIRSRGGGRSKCSTSIQTGK